MADGVGGWARDGIDSGLFSKKLAGNIKKRYDKHPSQSIKSILAESVKQNRHIGSSTCIIVSFHQTQKDILKTLILGDSGYLILRLNPKSGKFNKIFRSKE